MNYMLLALGLAVLVGMGYFVINAFSGIPEVTPEEAAKWREKMKKRMARLGMPMKDDSVPPSRLRKNSV